MTVECREPGGEVGKGRGGVGAEIMARNHAMLRDDHEGWQGGLIHNRADFSGIGWPVVRKTEELVRFYEDLQK